MKHKLGTLIRLSASPLLLGAVLVSTGCGGDDNGNEAEAPRAAKTSLNADECAALAGMVLGDGTPDKGSGSIDTAVWNAAKAEADPTKSTPDHCQIKGAMNRRSNGLDGSEPPGATSGNASYAINFELRLPATWNRKFFFQGYGGTEGMVLPALGARPGAVGETYNALQRGYAVVTTDTGHTPQPGANGAYRYGYDPQARLEYAYQATSIVTHAARGVLQKAFAQGPARSYFVGGSGGGRQGMKATQVYPELFDGVIAVVPAMRVPLASIANMVMVQEQASISAYGLDGVTKDIATAFAPAQLRSAADEILRQCDALDGVADGMVFSPSRCRFDPQALRCAAPGVPGGCFTQPQIDVFKRIHDGIPQYASWYYDPGLVSGWPAHRLGKVNTVAGAPNDASIATLMAGYLAFDAITPPLSDPSANLYEYMLSADPIAEAAKLSATSAKFPRATSDLIYADSPDLDRFAARNGRLLIVHGLADPYFSAVDTQRYVDRVIDRYGDRAKDIVRLFLVPGMNHGRDGPTTDVADLLGVLDAWVDSGVSPAQYEASVRPNNPALPADWSKTRTRKICAYPTEAQYVGGDKELAASFECR